LVTRRRFFLWLASVTVAYRLLPAARGSGGFISPITTLTTADDGGWTQKPRSRAIAHAGYVYVGYVSGTGDVKVIYRPDSTGVVSSPITLHAAFQVDTHAAPAMFVRSDAKLLVMYCGHNGGVMYQRVSVNTLDADPTLSGGFVAEASAFSGATYTYPMLVGRSSESPAAIYNFHRDNQSGTAVLSYRKSTDDGATWGTAHEVYKSTGNFTYWDVFGNGTTRIDFVVTDCLTTDQLGDLYHFYADLSDYHKSDGTVISGSQPWTPSQLTLVYDKSTSGRAWSHDGYLSGSNPVFIFGIAPTWSPAGGTDTEYRYARWTGSAWTVTSILASGGAGQYDPMLACLDPVDPTVAYLTRYLAGHFEIWRYVTSDSGATWSGGAITSGSSVDNIYPVTVRDHPSGQLAVLWLDGTYTSATSNSLGIMGRMG
jgi:hypothetical protein